MASILIAEDEKPIRELIRRNLLLVGHSCREAADGREALELAEAERFDLALLDVMLPGTDGFEVKRRLPQELPVIFVTARTGLSSRLQGLGLGADDYILKPFEILEIAPQYRPPLCPGGSGGIDDLVAVPGCDGNPDHIISRLLVYLSHIPFDPFLNSFFHHGARFFVEHMKQRALQSGNRNSNHNAPASLMKSKPLFCFFKQLFYRKLR